MALAGAPTTIIPSDIADNMELRTNELSEMELIEILWRQDIDLGIGREMFEASLLRTESDEKEFNLEKNYPTEEIRKDEEIESIGSRNSFPVLDLSANYIIDGETGEIVSLPPQVQTPESNGGAEDFFELFPDILETDDALEQSDISSVVFHSIYDQCSSDNLTDCSYELSGENALEQRWQDVIGLLNLPDIPADDLLTGLNDPIIDPDAVTQNASLADLTFCQPPMMSHGTSLSPFPLLPESKMNAAFQLVSAETMPSVSPPSPGLPFGEANATFLNMDDVSVLRLTSVDFMGVRETHVSNFSSSNLQSLFQNTSDDNENLEESFENDCPPGVGINHHAVSEDISSDSGISSSSSPLQDVVDQSVGATGGKDEESTCDLNLEIYRYNADPEFRSGSPSLETNSSKSSNDTNFRGSKSTVKKHVNRARTHQPGQIAPEEKDEEALKRDRKEKATRSRDEKRAKEMKLPFTVSEITNTPVEDFTQILARFLLSESQQQLIQDIRRRGKNKQAAQNCRKRKLSAIQTLEEEIDRLQGEENALIQSRRQLDHETARVKEKLLRLQTELFRSLRDDNGQPYNANEYSLQQLPDGNMFLVPKSNNAVEKDHVEKPVKKRKPKRKE